jgi:hypothetical protein
MSSSSARKRSRSTDAAAARTTTRTPRVQVEKAKDLDEVLAKCRALRTELRNKDTASPAEPEFPDSIPSDIVEVAELSTTEVLDGIEGVAVRISHQILAKKGFSMDIPSRASTNQVYVKEWDRIVLGGKRSNRTFLNVKVRFEEQEWCTLLLENKTSNPYLSFCHFDSLCRSHESRPLHFE